MSDFDADAFALLNARVACSRARSNVEASAAAANL